MLNAGPVDIYTIYKQCLAEAVPGLSPPSSLSVLFSSYLLMNSRVALLAVTATSVNRQSFSQA